MFHTTVRLVIALMAGIEILRSFPGHDPSLDTLKDTEAFRVVTLFISLYTSTRNVTLSLVATTVLLYTLTTYRQRLDDAAGRARKRLREEQEED